MTLVSLNIEGFHSNKEYLRHLIQKYQPDIIMLQETWLYAFQSKDIGENFPTYDVASKAVDDDDPLPPYKIPRGHGGIAIMWNRSLSGITVHPDGSHRILIISHLDMVIVNVYMPCRGSYSNQEYKDEIDQLHEVSTKFSNLKVILGGDFNIDLQKQRDSRANYLHDLLTSFGYANPTATTDPTFIHHNGIHSSRIDYVFFNMQWSPEEICTSSTLHDVNNTSSHLCLLSSFEYEPKYIKASSSHPIKRPKWDKADLVSYNSILDEMFDVSSPCASTEEAINYFISTVQQAANIAIPMTGKKHKKSPWNSDICQLVKNGKKADRDWKAAGCPPRPDQLFNARRQAVRDLRRAQRCLHAAIRQDNHEKISAASSDDKTLFFKLVKQQRSSNRSHTNELILDNTTYTEDLEDIWQIHFKRLATPQNNPLFNQRYAAMVNQDVQNINFILNSYPKSCIPITHAEVEMAISKLPNGKACDADGLAAEHLKHAKISSAKFLTPLLNKIFMDSKAPGRMKCSLTHPIPKKNKAPNLPTNARGISISPIVGKILDSIYLTHQLAARNVSHTLQFGFSKGKSCLEAAFILTESVAESRDTGNPIYIASLDVQKAFDTVTHSSLLRKLHEGGVTGSWWLLKKDLMDGMSARVMWEGRMSKEYKIGQGTKQGGLCSTDEYLKYQFDLLVQVFTSEIGFNIGSINVTCPTVADDMILAASSPHDLQSLLWLCENYANMERYTIHPEKSVITPFAISSKAQLNFLESSRPWVINDSPVTVSSEFTHLGVQRSNQQAPNATHPAVEARLTTGRRTIYALMGVGMHGISGLPPAVSIHLYNIYVIPRLTYGLQCINLRKLDINALELQHRKFIRSILHLPPRTAIPSLHILSGVLPIEAILDQQRLMFLGNMLRSLGTPHDIIIRQWAVKNSSSQSWVTHTSTILRKYNLPDIASIKSHAYSKPEWKKLVKRNIVRIWRQQIEIESIEKSTLVHLNPSFSLNSVHISLDSLQTETDTRRANTKWRVLTGIYTLQSVRHIYGQAPNSQCLLCCEADEDLDHFILECPALCTVRHAFIPSILNCIPSVFVNTPLIYNSHALQVQLILDCSHQLISDLFTLPHDVVLTIERLSRRLLNNLHLQRAIILKDMSQN